MEGNRWPLLITPETMETLAREKGATETWDAFLERLVEPLLERGLTGVKRELWEDLKDAIVPVLKKWDVPGSSAGRWDLYEALGLEVAKMDWTFKGVRDEKGTRSGAAYTRASRRRY